VPSRGVLPCFVHLGSVFPIYSIVN